jgi:hypothetical protein
MAGAAEGVWLDSESIHPIDSDCTIGQARFNWRGSDSRFAAKSREVLGMWDPLTFTALATSLLASVFWFKFVQGM